MGIGIGSTTQWDAYFDETYTLSSPRDLGIYTINEDRDIYEYFNGKMNKRNKVGGRIEGQDIDVSVSGVVYATTFSRKFR